MRPPRKRTTKLTAGELAAEKGVSSRSVCQAIALGNLRAERKGRSWLISRKDADAWSPRLGWAPGRPRKEIAVDEELTECIYCCHDVPDTDPKELDEAGWAEIAKAHAADCEWVLTRAHTRDEDYGVVD